MVHEKGQRQDAQEATVYTINGEKYKIVYDEFRNEYWLPKKRYDAIVANNEKNDWVFDSTLGYGGSYGKQNDGYRDASYAPRMTGMHGVNKRVIGNTRDVGSNLSLYMFPQNLGIQMVGMNATQAMAGSGMSYGGVGQSWDEYVARNTTGVGFAADVTEKEVIAKMPLPSYLGYGVKDNYELIAEIEKQHKEKIEFCLKVIKNAVPSIVIELAEKGVILLPPNIRGCALAIIIMIDICLAAKEAYDKWDEDVRTYEQEHECSREVAEENVRFLKEGLDTFMSFSMAKWTKYVLDSIEVSADITVEIVTAVLKSISEEKLKEWGRTIRDWRRENVDPYLLYW